MPLAPATDQLASWRRAAAVAGATGAVTGVAACVLAWLLATESMSTGQLLTTAGALLAGAFGAGVEGRMSGSLLVVSGTARGSAHVVPLTLTLLAGATSVAAFRRATRRSRGGWPDLVDAARSACVLAALVLAVGLLARTDSGGVLVALDWIAARDADQVGGSLGVTAWQAPLGAFVLTFALLGTTCLLRGDGWPPAVARAADRLRPAVRGVVTLLLLLPVAGLLGLLMLVGGDAPPAGAADVEPASGVGLALAGLASWGVAVLALGAGGPAGRTVAGTASGDLDVALGAFHHRLGHWTEQEPGLWASVPVLLVVLALSARSVVRACDDVRRVPGDLVRWLLLLALVVPALGLAARLSGEGSVEGEVWGDSGRGELAATLGVELLPASLSLLAVAALVALGVGGTTLSRARRARTLEASGATPVDREPSDGHAPTAHP
ncbi:hypothetical protein [Nocardioides solisilvae]|uniref:hypothetical protein n=1 Tax=Nocardioides solisilvae TaxID=1542435 RepID=UPI000D748D55|nr:hypothetical protein [Nocardioides solisilvae]